MKKLALLLSLAAPLYANAQDFGRIGATFPIGEVDMLVWIEQRLKGFEASGKLDEMKEAFIARVKKNAETPAPLELPTTLNPAEFHVDPSLTLAKDLVDPNTGNVFAKAGTVINPFDTRTWPDGQKLPQFEYSHALAFFDARDAQQLTWAQNLTATKPIKWVLTGGSPNQVAEQLNHRIYFDQQGLLTEQLHIKHVPSLVEQSGLYWKVTEFDVSALQSKEPK